MILSTYLRSKSKLIPSRGSFAMEAVYSHFLHTPDHTPRRRPTSQTMEPTVLTLYSSRNPNDTRS
jgi:hypothetical protein